MSSLLAEVRAHSDLSAMPLEMEDLMTSSQEMELLLLRRPESLEEATSSNLELTAILLPMDLLDEL